MPLPLYTSLRLSRASVRRPKIWFISTLAFTLSSCGGATDLLLPGDGQPATIQVADGNGQSGRVGEPLNNPLVFEVTDSRGRAVEGAQVVFSVIQAGPGAAVVPDTAITDANGQATAQFQLGTTIGPQAGEASVVMAEGTQQPKTGFTATAVSENANEMALLSGDGQSGPAGSALGQPLAVQVTDAFGNPISGVPISWSVEGGGTVSESSNFTDDQGTASVIRTLGPAAGPQATIATSEGLAGSPVTFTHTATAGSASLLSIVSGDNQTAVAGSELPGDLVVRLVDAQGNGVPDAAVTWVVGTGGGRVSPENTTTDEAGRTSARWTLGANPGQNRADAVVSGVAVVHFQATGTSGAPSRLVVVTQPSSSTQNAVMLGQQPVVQVRDAGGADIHIPGIEITAQLAGGGGELLGTRLLRTDANGRVAFTDLAIAGAEGRRTLVFTAVGYAGATSSAINVQAISTTTTIIGDSPDPSAAGALVTVSFRVSAAAVTPIGDVTVSGGGQSCTGTLNGGSGSCQIPLTSAGQLTLRAAYPGSPGLQGSSGTAEHEVSAPVSTNKPPKADFHWHCDGLTCDFTDASSDSDGRVATWSWDFGDGHGSTEQAPSHTFPAAARYTVKLTITDDDGAGAQTDSPVDVKAPPPPPANKPPHADFDVSCRDLTCTFTDHSRDDDGAIQGELWDYGDGTPASSTPSHTYTTPGKYKVTLTVTDNDGDTGTKTKDADAKAAPPGNQPPTAAFSAPSCTATVSCQFTDGSSDDGQVTGWDWNFGDGSEHSHDQNPTHTYGASGPYTVTLTVTDNDHVSSDPVQHQVTVGDAPNQPPTAQIGMISCTGMNCQFHDASTDANGADTIQQWSWVFDDGNSSQDQNPSHQYAQAGAYTVKLTVTDDHDAQDSTQQTLTIAADTSSTGALIARGRRS